MSNRSKLRLSRLTLGLAVALAAAPAFAQQTSSALSGVIMGEDGRPVAGADVLISHTPSGTISRATTDENGRYVARGLRVGGPYTVLVLKSGYQSKSQADVQLALAQTSTLSLTIEPAAQEMDVIEVIGTAQSQVFSPDAMGAGSNISGEMISALPSIRRDLQDYARLDPRISQTDKERSEISALGQNARFNSITIDSVSTSDTFGLASNNLPTLRQPISLEAIEEVQINIVNYDVTQRGYTGANINAVTKAGTNEFHGSVYGDYRDGDWIRETDDRGRDFNGFEHEQNYGVTFGGPIIKDRLFFFVNYDKTEIAAPGPELGSGPFGTRITADDVQQVVDIATGYGMQPGGLEAGGIDTEVETFLGRFDWNINDYHRAAFRFSTTDEAEARLPGFGTNFFSLSSYWYQQTTEFDNYVAEIFSDWTDSFSTEARVYYRDFLSAPVLAGQQPQVEIRGFDGGANFRFGTEQFRHANLLETKTLNGYFAGNLFLGEHDIKVGVDYERNDIYNLFLESSLGNYTFSSIADFASGQFERYLYRTSTSGNLDDAAAAFELSNWGFFVQDTWSVNYNLTLNFGLRYDLPQVDRDPVFNQDFFNAFGLRNNTTIDGNGLFQPRAGFNYTFDSDRPMQLRGGVGLFQGAAASVWLANPYTNNGETISIFGCNTGGFGPCGADAPLFVPDPFNQPEFASGSGPRADVDLVSPDLEQPSVWKANLAIEHELPWQGVVASAEVILTAVESGIYYEHLNLGQASYVADDGRTMYWRNPTVTTVGQNYTANNNRFNGSARNGSIAGFNEVLLAKETSKGSGQNLTLSLTKPMGPDDNLFWQVAYSYTDADEVNPLTSSRAISNWRSHAVLNSGEEVASRSPYVSRDRFTAAVSYRHFFFDGHKTEFSMFYEGRRGKPYSWVFNNDANGDNQAGNDLLYIPSGPNDVIFTDPAEADTFWQIVNENGLAGYGGGAVDRNSHFAPWVNSFDIRISQELPGFFGENKAEIWLDVLNVGNLVNKDWGHVDEVFFQSDGGTARSFVNFAGIDQATGRYIYDVVDLESFGRRDADAVSRWALKVGFRYRF